MEALDHVAIAIPDKESVSLWEKLLGQSPFHTEEVPEQGVKVYFFQVGPTKIELLEPLSPESAVARFLEKKGPGLHHIAFYVEELSPAVDKLKAAGATPLSETPQPAALGKKAIFFHPRTTGGVLVELVTFA
ncbi:MAG: methylmalonyl-CoA epimerase [Bacteroidia bacterium]|jgi:methylmalonyl-CoA/ethylmalonyl-CoA epimerase|nr:methylmalonyl-CoA epimerase [Bacteroidia bacterium]GIV23207.1 MAG: methylmalonyl-CoA epimerase [Bacteroidia bacterium]